MKIKISRILKQLLCVTVCSLMLFGVSAEALSGTDEIPYNSYTYWEDLSSGEKTAAYTKPMYEVERTVTSRSIGVEPFLGLTDVFTTDDGYIYLIDGSASRLLRLDSNFKYVSGFNTIKTPTGEIDFKDSTGIFVDEKGLIYICGTEAGKLWITDNDGKLVDELTVPDSEIIPDNFKYRPIKVAKDNSGYIYILSDGSYHGAILYSPEREFLGFYGANSVNAGVLSTLKSLWTRLTMSDAKRSAIIKQLPYQFMDMAIDERGFVYTATGNTGEDDQKGQIKKLNPAGMNILDSDSVNFADVGYGIYKNKQDISGIDIDEEGYIYVSDSTYGRIFVYDIESKLLCAFGSGKRKGDQKGSFENLTAISVYGQKILACDKNKGTLTVFKETEYGRLVKKTRLLTVNSKYSESKEGWEQVLSQDRNSQLAYVGLAKAALSEKEYGKALEYAKTGADREIYSTAFEYVRRDFFARHFTLIFIGIVALAVGLVILFVYKRKKKIVFIKNKTVRTVFSVWSSPFKTFGDIKEKKGGSLIACGVIVALFYVSAVVKTVYSGFAFSYYSDADYSVLYTLVSTVGLILLWVTVNWAVCTLLGGIGTVKEITVATCYGTVPVIIANFCYAVLTNVLTATEGEFLSIFMVVMYAFAFFLIAVGIMRVHDYGFGRFIGTTVLTVLGMMLVVFLIFLIGLLVQQLASFIVSVAYEIIY